MTILYLLLAVLLLYVVVVVFAKIAIGVVTLSPIGIILVIILILWATGHIH